MTGALILTRVSTEKQDQYSPELQKQRSIAYCASKGWDVIDVVQEEISGRKEIEKRALDEILRRKDWDVLVVYKIDRLARRARIIHEVLELLEKQGRKFASVEESIDTSTAMGWGFLAIVAAFAEIESRVIGERAVRGHAASAQKYKTMRNVSKWFAIKDENGQRVLYPTEAALGFIRANGKGLTESQYRRLRRIVVQWDATKPWILAPKRIAAP